jgi:hypothetical protein
MVQLHSEEKNMFLKADLQAETGAKAAMLLLNHITIYLHFSILNTKNITNLRMENRAEVR